MDPSKTPHPLATAVEICFRIGIVMAMVGVAFIAFTSQGPVYSQMLMSFQIFGYKMAFSGGMYMVCAPAVRYLLMNYLWKFHFVCIFIGLFIVTRTGSSLLQAKLMDTTVAFALLIPIGIVVLKTKFTKNGATPATPKVTQ